MNTNQLLYEVDSEFAELEKIMKSVRKMVPLSQNQQFQQKSTTSSLQQLQANVKNLLTLQSKHLDDTNSKILVVQLVNTLRAQKFRLMHQIGSQIQEQCDSQDLKLFIDHEPNKMQQSENDNMLLNSQDAVNNAFYQIQQVSQIEPLAALMLERERCKLIRKIKSEDSDQLVVLQSILQVSINYKQIRNACTQKNLQAVFDEEICTQTFELKLHRAQKLFKYVMLKQEFDKFDQQMKIVDQDQIFDQLYEHIFSEFTSIDKIISYLEDQLVGQSLGSMLYLLNQRQLQLRQCKLYTQYKDHDIHKLIQQQSQSFQSIYDYMYQLFGDDQSDVELIQNIFEHDQKQVADLNVDYLLDLVLAAEQQHISSESEQQKTLQHTQLEVAKRLKILVHFYQNSSNSETIAYNPNYEAQIQSLFNIKQKLSSLLNEDIYEIYLNYLSSLHTTNIPLDLIPLIQQEIADCKQTPSESIQREVELQKNLNARFRDIDVKIAAQIQIITNEVNKIQQIEMKTSPKIEPPNLKINFGINEMYQFAVELQQKGAQQIQQELKSFDKYQTSVKLQSEGAAKKQIEAMKKQCQMQIEDMFANADTEEMVMLGIISDEIEMQ
ncbi:Conserved_hypothetical protein [Hexamita inflata]|uniref:Uncharacterized protein n=1 Tax=Hexamita inflata TaxID=28002 RepID=A0AA86TZ58_9EUKA|nr:Conserved hypothetical protein [Hexamita inflata]